MLTTKYGFGIKGINKTKSKNILFFTLGFIGFFLLLFLSLGHPLKNNKKFILHVSMNDGLDKVTTELKENNIIKSKFLLRTFVSMFNSSKTIKTGDYLFAKNSPVFIVARQLAKGDHMVNPLKITLIEGYTNKQMGNKLAKYLPSFDLNTFTAETKNLQGYLFPDTYFFYKYDTTDEIVSALKDNFSNQIKKINQEIRKSDKSLKDIIIMASLIQKEARGKNDSPIISGILWKRISLSMPLQVDAYRETYKNKGLPSKPICNPGLYAIEAAASPQNSPYLYYVHDKNGNVHYAKTFTEHKRNIRLYLINN